MEFPKLTENLSIISSLGDNPGVDNGLTAEGLKAKFDEAALILQRYINEKLVEGLNEIFAGGPAVPSDGFNMNGPINMNRQPIWNVRDPVGDGDALNLQFANATYVPKARTINGKSLADNLTLSAKDVGARSDTWLPTLAEIGAAPSGYGLGGVPSYITDCNTATDTGWYKWDVQASNAPFANGIMQVVGRVKNTSALQIAYMMSASSVLAVAMRRINKANGVYDAWEYINPPMIAGTPYRTAERWNGKPVYAKLIHLGPMQANGLANHAIGDVLVSDNAMPIELKAYVTDGTNIYDLTANIFTAGGAYLWNNGAQWYVNVTCSFDMSAFTGNAIVKWIYN